MMNCSEAGPLISAYADGEVDGFRRPALARHINACSGCRARHDAIVALRDRIGAEVPYFAATPALKARVQAMANAMAPSTARRAEPAGERWRWLSGGVLAGCTATVFAWIIGTAVITAQTENDVVTAAVANHVRATRDNRLIEVASSDRHTVKPWLSAHLDYSPPVQDFAAEGFVLIGSRIDRLDQHAVATLVYRHGQHTIDVFVRPQPSRGSFSPLRTVRGFNVVHESGQSMDWLAVSDVEAAVLAEFVRRLAREEPSK